MPETYRIQAAAAENAAELLIYGDIGDTWWGESVTAKSIAEQLQELDVEYITVRINSYGGAVSDALAIYNSLRRHPAAITVQIDGVAVSAASLIAMAGDTVEIGENSMFMVHAPWFVAVGNSKRLRDSADLLDKYADAMASSYARKTGKAVDEVRQLLTDGEDHWYTGAEAVEEGFADVLFENEEDSAAAGFEQSVFAASALRHAGEATQRVAAGLRLPGQQAAQVAAHRSSNPEDKAMPKAKENPATANPAANQPSAEEVEASVRAAETERRTEIRQTFAAFTGRDGVQQVLDACLDDMNVTVDQARNKLLAHLGQDATPLAAGGRVEMGETEQEKFAKGAEGAIMARAGLGQDDPGNEFRSYSLIELARRSLSMHGVSTSRMDKMGVVAAAFTHSTSDFTNLLANIANKALQRGAEEAEETFQLWTSVGQLPDFKVGKRVDLNAFPSLDAVPEGAEYHYATVGDRGEEIQLATYGKLFSITRPAIINDDLDAFTRIPMRMGRAAIRTVGDLVYAVLTSNPAMSDGTALFHANHKNLLTGAAPSTAAVDAMRVAMATQKDGDATLNIRLANVIVPVALEGAAKVVRDSEFEVGASSRNNTTPNSVRGTFQVIADGRLDADSAAAWYGAASPGVNDTIEVAYLDGNSNPTLEQQNGWNVDGVEFKVRLDAGVSPLDFRTMAKNPGNGS